MSISKKKFVKKNYDPHLKSTVCMEVLSGKLTYLQAARQYGIVSERSIREWVLRYGKPPLVSNFDDMASKTTGVSTPQEDASSNKELKTLQKALELAKLENLALHTMIDIAESELNIDIRKKSGTKQ